MPIQGTSGEGEVIGSLEDAIGVVGINVM